jgi:hypothetical protein
MSKCAVYISGFLAVDCFGTLFLVRLQDLLHDPRLDAAQKNMRLLICQFEGEAKE